MKSRREFLSEASLAGAGLLLPALGCSGRCAAAPQDQTRTPASRARVVLVRSPAVLDSRQRVVAEPLRRMLAQGLARLSGKKDARAALAGWLRTNDTVGLKVNCLAGRQMSTHRELTEAVVALLAARGLPRGQAIVFDRSNHDLRLAGYPLRQGGKDYRCQGNEEAGYESELTVMPHGASRFALTATRSASVLINLPVLKDHGIAGVTAALKNNFGLVHNPNKFHLNGCDPHVAEVNAQPAVQGKQRLVICDALRVQVDGGPGYSPAGVEAFGGLLLATDPVALDVVAYELLEQLRRARKLPSLVEDKRPPVHIAGAARAGLGVGERSKITLVEIELS